MKCTIMKKIMFSWLVSLFMISAASAQYGVERTGYDGDYFSLEGAIELFRESNSLRDFERKINRRDNWVNNLDLDYDGRVDYIRVEHRRQGDFHAIILQAPLSRYDVQDVAVIEIEQTGSREAVLQIVGDEDLYGEEIIVEPYEEQGYSSSRGGRTSEYDVRRDYVNVYYWPAVQDILRPDYAVYVSPYRWQYYPTWWSAWTPYTWYDYHPRIVVYRNRCRVVNIHRVVHVHNFYRPYRVYSPIVVQRTNVVRVNHGREPIHRPGVRDDSGYRDNQVDRNQVQQPRRTGTSPATTTRTPETRSDAGRNTTTRPDVSRNTTRTTTTRERTTTTTTTRPEATRTPQTRPDVSRNTTTRPSTSRTTTTRESATRTTTTRPNTSRTVTPRADTDPSTATRQSTTRTTTTRSNTTRTVTPRANTNSTTTTRPTPARTTAPRANTSRSSSEVQRPAVSRKSTTSSSSGSATRSAPVKKSGSTSRRGGGR